MLLSCQRCGCRASIQDSVTYSTHPRISQFTIINTSPSWAIIMPTSTQPTHPVRLERKARFQFSLMFTPKPSLPSLRLHPCVPSHDLILPPKTQIQPALIIKPPNNLRHTQGELGELDAQAGFGAHPPRAPAAPAGGDDNASRAGDGNAGRGGGGAGGGSSSSAAPPAAGAGQGLEEGGGGREQGGGGGGHWGSAGSASGRRGSLTDVMAHEIVIGCLVRLALVAEGETAQEVLSVLEQERGRAHVRERLGRGAIGPMEEVVAKVGIVGRGIGAARGGGVVSFSCGCLSARDVGEGEKQVPLSLRCRRNISSVALFRRPRFGGPVVCGVERAQALFFFFCCEPYA